MTQYNVNFELTVEDMDLIEDALRQSKSALSSERISSPRVQKGKPCNLAEEIDESMRQIQDLLGRLHNQKVFFRPRGEVYVGG